MKTKIAPQENTTAEEQIDPTGPALYIVLRASSMHWGAGVDMETALTNLRKAGARRGDKVAITVTTDMKAYVDDTGAACWHTGHWARSIGKFTL